MNIRLKENIVFSYCESLRYMWNNYKKKQMRLFSIMSNFQTYYHFKLDLQKVV